MTEASGHPETARRYLARVIATCRRIGTMPLAGRARDDLLPGLRTHAFERSAVIAYRVIDRKVEIVNVFHGRRDYEALYGSGEGEP